MSGPTNSHRHLILWLAQEYLCLYLNFSHPQFNTHVVPIFPCCLGGVAQRGPKPPHSWGFWITHNDASQAVGLLWMNYQLVAEAWQSTILISVKIHTPAGFELSFSAGERPQTYALARKATRTSSTYVNIKNIPIYDRWNLYIHIHKVLFL